MKRNDRNYVYSLGKYILVVTVIFVLSLITGVVISIKNPGISENYLETFKLSVSWIKTLNPLIIMFVIFLNNAIKSLIALILGIVLGIIPILFVAGNGVIVGMLAEIVSRQRGTPFVIASTVPHGIIEIPMILISTAIGLRLGFDMYLSLIGRRVDIKQELSQGIGFFIRVIAPLFLVAAAIETFITPLIASLFV